jgi:hypothetical protein
MILGLELKLACSYDFSKVTSCCKEFVGDSRSFFPLHEQFLKVGILFGGKKEPTGKFAGCALTSAGN